MTDSNTRIVNNRYLHGALWLAQALVAVSFCWAGVMKVATPIAQLALTWPWTGDLPVSAVRLLGWVDLAGGLGVCLPAFWRFKLGLTSLAALGCVFLQICAMVFHAARGEMAVLPVNAVFLAVCTFIAWGRWKR